MTTALTIGVRYSCHACGLSDIEVRVPAREEEDVLVWMDTMGHALKADHRSRSPACRATSAQNVKVPVAGTDRVGGAPVQ
jgi:hypothetical protein